MSLPILICDDDETTLSLLEGLIKLFGHEPILARTGEEALQILTSSLAPRLAILDWMLPDLCGVDVCKTIRKTNSIFETYVILLTGLADMEHLELGLEAGANDFIKKPFHQIELRARLNLGIRLIEHQTKLKMLSGKLSVCSECRTVRDKDGGWKDLASFLTEASGLRFSHGICQPCLGKLKSTHNKQNIP